jgi:hypothetical protein
MTFARSVLGVSIIALAMVNAAFGETYMTAPRDFQANDFLFYDAFGQKWAKIIIKGVNKVAHENSECVKISPASADFSGEDQEPKANPTFSVACENAAGTEFRVEFKAQDVLKGNNIRKVLPISESDALTSCKDTILARSVHPSTVRFSWLEEKLFWTVPGSHARLEIRFSASNSLNLTLDYEAACIFVGQAMDSIVINEDNGK